VGALLALLAVVGGGCGGNAAAGGPRERPQLVVSAAASLGDALAGCAPRFADADVRLSLAGSDELAAQIRQGVEPDVYAAANMRLPRELARENLLREPVAFATNELVLAVGADSAIASLADLGREGVTLAIGSESVPVGAYTRDVLDRLDDRHRAAILANVRSNEPDVRGVVGKLAQGAADAGFVYRSDVRASRGRLEAIALPDRLRPAVAYGAGVVEGARRPALARRYVDDLRGGACARALRDAGFGPPPR
jgi:molybdate transport system substrate-binding protein